MGAMEYLTTQDAENSKAQKTKIDTEAKSMRFTRGSQGGHRRR